MKLKFKLVYILALASVLVAVFVLGACAGGNKNNVILDNEGTLSEVYAGVGEGYSFGRPVRDGYTFVAWYDSKTGGTALTDNRGDSNGLLWNSEEKTTVYARWTANTYILKFDYQGATSGGTTTQMSVVYDTEIGNMPIPVKEGNEFLGWYTAVSGGEMAASAGGLPTENYKIYKAPQFNAQVGEEYSTVLYARWGTAKMQISFETNGGTAVAQIADADSGSIIQAMPLTGKDNKLFLGWYRDAELAEKAEFPFTVPYNSSRLVTLYAKYADATMNRLFFTTTDDKVYSVRINDTAFTGEIIVPDMYFGKKVTALESFANGRMTKISLPHSITSIAASAFKGCADLTEINLPMNVTSIPESTFENCVSLTSVVVPESVTGIGGKAFAECRSLKELRIPSKVSTIGTGATLGCNTLNNLTVAEGNTAYIAENNVLYRNFGSYYHLAAYAQGKEDISYEINAKTQRILDYAFYGAKNLKYVRISNKINTVGEYAFANCISLVRAEIKLDFEAIGVTPTIGNNAFNGDTRLKAVIVDNAKVPTLGGSSVFTGVSNVFTIYVPSTQISTYRSASNWSAFNSTISGINEIFGDFAVVTYSTGYAIKQYLGGDETVTIPEHINGQILAINTKAFAYADNLKTVTIPQYVTMIADEAFAYCPALQNVYCEPQTPPSLSSNAFSNTNSTFNIYVPSGTSVINAYRSAANWSLFGSSRIWTKS